MSRFVVVVVVVVVDVSSVLGTAARIVQRHNNPHLIGIDLR